MLKIFVIIGIWIMIFIYQGVPLIKKRYIKELAVFTFLLLISLVLTILQILNISIHSPAKYIEYGVRLFLEVFNEARN